MRHKSSFLTQRYANHFIEGLRDGVEILDRICTEFSNTGGERNYGEVIGDRKIGGREGIRTLDPRIANAVLSQLSYSPVLADKRV